MDDNGTVSLSPSNLPPDTVVDYASGAEVRLADAATSLTLSPLTGNYWTTCSELCHVVWHREPREMITTPMNATLSCSSDREVLLKSGALVLEMTSDSSEAFHGGCLAGDGSTLPAGAPLSSSPWVRIKAFLHDQQVDIVVTQDGHLRSGSANIGDQSCPCRVQP